MKDRKALVRHMVSQTRTKCESQLKFLGREMACVERDLRPLKKLLHSGEEIDDREFGFTMCLIARLKMHMLFQDAYIKMSKLKTDFDVSEIRRHVRRHVLQVVKFDGFNSRNAKYTRMFFIGVLNDLDAKQHLLQKIL